jgi:hypothetical protein
MTGGQDHGAVSLLKRLGDWFYACSWPAQALWTFIIIDVLAVVGSAVVHLFSHLFS